MSDQPEHEETNKERYERLFPERGGYSEPNLGAEARYELLLEANGIKLLADAAKDVSWLIWNVDKGHLACALRESGNRIRALEATVAKLEERLAALESRASLAIPPVNEP